MKTCNKCGLLKEDDKFRKPRLGCKACEAVYAASPEGRARSRNGMRKYRMKPGIAERERDTVREKRKDPKIRAVVRANERRSHLKRRRWINLLKMERPCYDCGGMFPPEATDWDHLPGKEKLFGIGTTPSSYSLEEVVDEISKCQLVCACCHRIRTAARRPERKGS